MSRWSRIAIASGISVYLAWNIESRAPLDMISIYARPRAKGNLRACTMWHDVAIACHVLLVQQRSGSTNRPPCAAAAISLLAVWCAGGGCTMAISAFRLRLRTGSGGSGKVRQHWQIARMPCPVWVAVASWTGHAPRNGAILLQSLRVTSWMAKERAMGEVQRNFRNYQGSIYV